MGFLVELERPTNQLLRIIDETNARTQKHQTHDERRQGFPFRDAHAQHRFGIRQESYAGKQDDDDAQNGQCGAEKAPEVVLIHSSLCVCGGFVSDLLRAFW